MGADEKHAASFYDPASGEEGYVPSVEFARGGYIYDRITLGVVDAEGAKAEFDRLIAKLRAEAKAEALEEAASEIYRLDGDDAEMYNEDLNATPVTAWLRARANQYKETP